MSATASRARADRVLLIVLALAATPALALARGSVVYATATHAYLDRGADAGLAPGQTVALRRKGKPAAKCTVETVFEARAVCTHRGARPGDVFETPSKAAGARGEDGALKPVPSDESLARSERVVSSAVVPTVRYRGVATGAVTAALASVSFEHGTWAATSASDGPFHGERVDLSLRELPLWFGLRFSTDASAIGWARRPSRVRQPLGRAQLFVRQLEVSRRTLEPGVTFTAGRFWPARAPGVGTLDGVQLGYGDPRAGWEGGVLVGARPVALSTDLSLEHPVFGLYAAHTLSTDGVVQRTQEQVRLTAEIGRSGLRVEAEADARAWLGRVADVGAALRAVTAPGIVFPIELARLDAQLRPAAGWRVSGGARFTSPTDLTQPREVIDRAMAGHADLLLGWDSLGWLGLALGGTASRELSTGNLRAEAGPDVQLPRLFGDRGGLGGGYRYGVGWLGGHSGHLQAVVAPVPALRLIARASYFSARSPSPSLPAPELGLYASAEYLANRWLRLRATAWSQVPLDVVGWPGEGGGPRYATLTATAGVAARF